MLDTFEVDLSVIKQNLFKCLNSLKPRQVIILLPILLSSFHSVELMHYFDLDFIRCFNSMDKKWKFSLFVYWISKRIQFYKTRKYLISCEYSTKIICLFVAEYQRNTIEYEQQVRPIWNQIILYSINYRIRKRNATFYPMINCILHQHLAQWSANMSREFLSEFDSYRDAVVFTPQSYQYLKILKFTWLSIKRKEHYFADWLNSDIIRSQSKDFQNYDVFNLFMSEYLAQDDVLDRFDCYIISAKRYLRQALLQNTKGFNYCNADSAMILFRKCFVFDRDDVIFKIWDMNGVRKLFDDKFVRANLAQLKTKYRAPFLALLNIL